MKAGKQEVEDGEEMEEEEEDGVVEVRDERDTEPRGQRQAKAPIVFAQTRPSPLKPDVSWSW